MSKSKHGGKITVSFTERAIRELHSIELYSTAQCGKRTADQYLQSIQDAADRICSNPDLLQSDARIPGAFVYFRAGKHVLICQELSQLVCVLTILHTSMDLSSRLLDLEPQLLLEAQILAAHLLKSKKPSS